MNSSYSSLARLAGFAIPVVCLCSGPLSSQHQFSDLGRSHLPVDGESTHAVIFADLDGDGYADMVAGNGGATAEQNRIYRNDTFGGFVDVTAQVMAPGLDATRDVAAGDVDGDGDIDLVFGNLGIDRLLLNDGSGNMVDMTAARMPMNNDQTSALALRDLDGDGDLDLLVVNVGQNRLLLNDGTGTFTDVTAQNLPADGSAGAGLAVGDLDGDGDLDAIIANSGPSGSQNHLYRNEGGARFVNATGGGHMPALSDDSRGVAVADVNGDRSLDIVVANHGRNVLLLNVKKNPLKPKL